MKISNVCMECKKDPEPFETSEGEIAYWMIVRQEESTVLMSNLEYNFVVSLDRSYVAQDGDIFLCSNCYEHKYGEEK